LSQLESLRVYQKIPRRIPLSLGWAKYGVRLDPSTLDYLTVPHDASLNVSSITMESFLYLHELPSERNEHAVLMNKAWLSQYAYFVHRVGDKVMINIRAGGTANYFKGDIVLKKFKWYHVAVTYDQIDMKIYVNGVLDKSVAHTVGGPIDTTTTDMYIGYESAIPSYANMVVCHQRLYDVALTQKQLQYNILNYHRPITSGLIMWLPYLTGSGTTVYDKTDKGNDAAFNGSPSWERVRKWELRSDVLG